jgi:hypothetical protein
MPLHANATQAILTFGGPYIVMYSYNDSQRDAAFLRSI